MTNVYVGVAALEHYDLPGRLGDMRAWIERQWDSIPAEYRDEARFDIDGEGRVEIHYWRPETEEELEQRKIIEQRETAFVEGRERALLSRLKAKYEGKS